METRVLLELLIRSKMEQQLQRVRDAYEITEGLTKLEHTKNDVGPLAFDHLHTYLDEVYTLRKAIHHLDDGTVELVYDNFFSKKGRITDDRTTSPEEALTWLKSVPGPVSASLYIEYHKRKVMVAHVGISKEFVGSEIEMVLRHDPITYTKSYYQRAGVDKIENSEH